MSIAITSSLLAAYLPAESRAELFGDGQGIAAGVWAPRGKARPVDGGVVVSGRWAFCSGITHSDLLFAGCMVEGGANAAGERPMPSVVAIRKEDLQVLDTWHTLGLRGTGSHDAVADEVFVPGARTFSLFDGPVLDRPLYRFPVFGFFALSIAAAALGNARGAIDELVDWPRARSAWARPARSPSARPPMRRSPRPRRRCAPRGPLTTRRSTRPGRRPRTTSPSRSTCATAFAWRPRTRSATSADVVRSMYDLGGGTAIYDDSPLQRRFRDAHTATAHFQVNAASRELPGRLLLGQPADTATL